MVLHENAPNNRANGAKFGASWNSAKGLTRIEMQCKATSGLASQDGLLDLAELGRSTSRLRFQRCAPVGRQNEWRGIGLRDGKSGQPALAGGGDEDACRIPEGASSEELARLAHRKILCLGIELDATNMPIRLQVEQLFPRWPEGVDATACGDLPLASAT